MGYRSVVLEIKEQRKTSMFATLSSTNGTQSGAQKGGQSNSNISSA